MTQPELWVFLERDYAGYYRTNKGQEMWKPGQCGHSLAWTHMVLPWSSPIMEDLPFAGCQLHLEPERSWKAVLPGC